MVCTDTNNLVRINKINSPLEHPSNVVVHKCRIRSEKNWSSMRNICRKFIRMSKYGCRAPFEAVL